MTAVSILAVPAVLGAVGFGAAGVAGGSAAAAWQAGFGGAVQAGSLFAGCQSLAMGGAVAGTVGSVGSAAAGIGAAAGAIGKGISWLRDKQQDELE